VAYNNYNLGTFCAPVDLPAIGVNTNTPGGALLHSEVSNVLLLPVGAGLPSSWSTFSSLQAIIDNSDTTGAKGKFIAGKGEIPDPEQVNAVLGRVDVKQLGKIFTLRMEIPVWCVAYYEMLRTLQKNPLHLHVWYFTTGGAAFGGATGIRPFYIDCTLPNRLGAESVEVGFLTIRWRADGNPARVLMPELNGGTDEAGNLSVTMYRQQFTSVSSSTLTWTQNSGTIPPSPTVRVWVYQNGQKLTPAAYVVTEGTGVGESTIVIDANYYTDGNTYEIYAFF